MASGTITKTVAQDDYQTATVQVNKSIGTDSVNCYRLGNIVVVDLRTYTTEATGVYYETNETIFTLPVGFRPKSSFNCIGVRSNSQLTSIDSFLVGTYVIDTTGKVKCGNKGTYFQHFIMTTFPVE